MSYTSESFVDHLEDYVGETVTIFTTSGGQSGCGFTGFLLKVNCHFVRLITKVGPAPGCALGNGCNKGHGQNGYGEGFCNNYDIHNIGAVTDIPVDRIAAFVHNAV